MPKDTYLFDLNPKRALLCDGMQLIVARVSIGKGGKLHRQGIAFIRHGRSSLLRDLERRGIEPTPEALALINSVIPDASDQRAGGTEQRYRELIALHSAQSCQS